MHDAFGDARAVRFSLPQNVRGVKLAGGGRALVNSQRTPHGGQTPQSTPADRLALRPSRTKERTVLGHKLNAMCVIEAANLDEGFPLMRFETSRGRFVLRPIRDQPRLHPSSCSNLPD